MTDRHLATFLTDGMIFGLDVESVQEVLHDQTIEPVPRAPAAVVGLINLRGRVLAVTDLRVRMGLPQALGGTHTYVVVTGAQGLDVLRVDAPGEVVSVDSDDLLPVPDTTPAGIAAMLRGAYHAEAALILVVDLNRTLDTADGWVAMPHDGPGR